MADSDSEAFSAAPSASDHDLQPFFVLHKASSSPAGAAAQLDPTPRKSRGKTDALKSPAKSRGKSEAIVFPEEPDDPLHYEELRYRAFHQTWSKIEEEIEAVLRTIDRNLFDEVHGWILERFAGIASTRADCFQQICKPYPVIDGDDEICKRIPAGLILTRNAEFVDDLLTFHELGAYLKSKGCHVAYFSSLDFEAKHGIGDCLRSLLRQVVGFAPDVADISILAPWYCQRENVDKPLVVIIDDTEQCNGSTLVEFIMMLSEWIIKIPIVLIVGVATSINALKKLLPSKALRHLQPFTFASESSHERMNSIIEAVLVRQCFGFFIGYKVALFLKNYFLNHDGTLTSFLRALKIACAKHFYMEPLSFLCRGMLRDNCKHFLDEDCESLPNKLLGFAFDLPSCNRESFNEISGKTILCGLQELLKRQKCWSSVLLCLFEVGKIMKTPLVDLFCDALNPGFCKGGSIPQAIQKIRDLPEIYLINVLKLWEGHCREVSEIRDKVNDLRMMLLQENQEMTSKEENKNVLRSICRGPSDVNMGTIKPCNRVATLMENIVRDYLKSIESYPFHEIVCFKHVDMLQKALIGNPRRRIQVDLRQSQACIHGRCLKDVKVMVSSMHDTSIVYTLAQDYGDLVNIHDWYQSFKEKILSSKKREKRGMRSPVSKKANAATTPSDTTEAMIQARFCLAVKELQLAGLLRLPGKRRLDYVQRVAFGT